MPSSKTLIRRDTAFISENMNKNALIKALRKHGLTATKAIKPIVEALNASKVIIHNGDNPDDSWTEEVPDHAIRLRASQLAIELLGLKNAKPEPSQPKTNGALLNAINESDEIKMQQIVFNKVKNDKKHVNNELDKKV